MIGIIGAMEIEVCSFIEEMTEKEEKTVSGSTFVKGKLCGKEIVVVRCGIGKVASAMICETLITLYHPSVIINTGVAGTLDDDLYRGDVAISTGAVQHDFTLKFLGFAEGQIPGFDKPTFDADMETSNQLTAIGKEMGLKIKQGLICSGDQFIATHEQKNEILRKFPNGIACEMEGASIAQVCTMNDMPFAIVRAISDGANGEDLGDYREFETRMAKLSFQLVKNYLKK